MFSCLNQASYGGDVTSRPVHRQNFKSLRISSKIRTAREACCAFLRRKLPGYRSSLARTTDVPRVTVQGRRAMRIYAAVPRYPLYSPSPIKTVASRCRSSFLPRVRTVNKKKGKKRRTNRQLLESFGKDENIRKLRIF